MTEMTEHVLDHILEHERNSAFVQISVMRHQNLMQSNNTNTKLTCCKLEMLYTNTHLNCKFICNCILFINCFRILQMIIH